MPTIDLLINAPILAMCVASRLRLVQSNILETLVEVAGVETGYCK